MTEVIVCERQSHVELRVAVLSYTALPVFYPSQVILVVREIKVRQLTLDFRLYNFFTMKPFCVKL